MQPPLFRFAVIADSHIEPEPDGVSTRSNLRNATVVRMLNAHRPDFVIHCGDILHVPAFGPHFDAAAAVSKSIYRPLEMPIYSTPGNQDIGDKPSAWMPAPHANAEYTQAYVRHYGPAWQSIEHKGIHFVFINSPIMNSGQDIEKQQAVWLDAYLESIMGKRIFLITHYPIFLLEDDEAGHYDNIDEPARGWLLERIDRYKIEAVFAGHVHNFFYNRRKDSDYYILPSTAFVRRDYSEMFKIQPDQDAEFGRNEPGKLGFMLIDVLADGHRPHYVRSYGLEEAGTSVPADSMPSQIFCGGHIGLGVTLRHSWSEVTTLSANNTTDEFIRKRVRSDYPLEGVWHLGIKALRVFLDDLRDAQSRQRLSLLADLEYDILVQSSGLPQDKDIELMTTHAGIVRCWEIVLPVEQFALFPALLPTLPHQYMDIALAKFENSARYRHEQINYPHFLAAGFHSERDTHLLSDLIEGVAVAPGALSSIVYRTTPSEDPCVFAKSTRDQLQGTSLQSIITASWALAEPGGRQDDDGAIAGYALKLLAAATVPGCAVVLDLFADLDRGYYPRHGIVDRRYDPRPAGKLVRNVHRLFDRLEAPCVFVTSYSDEHGIWQARLRAGGVEIILSDLSRQVPRRELLPADVNQARGQATMIDLLTGEERNLNRASELGAAAAQSHPAQMPVFQALVIRDAD